VYRGVEVLIRVFFASALIRVEWSASRPSRFITWDSRLGGAPEPVWTLWSSELQPPILCRQALYRLSHPGSTLRVKLATNVRKCCYIWHLPSWIFWSDIFCFCVIRNSFFSTPHFTVVSYGPVLILYASIPPTFSFFRCFTLHRASFYSLFFFYFISWKVNPIVFCFFLDIRTCRFTSIHIQAPHALLPPVKSICDWRLLNCNRASLFEFLLLYECLSGFSA
jgi:hypothetical protein